MINIYIRHLLVPVLFIMIGIYAFISAKRSLKKIRDKKNDLKWANKIYFITGQVAAIAGIIVFVIYIISFLFSILLV
jgi:hypothetical protein